MVDTTSAYYQNHNSTCLFYTLFQPKNTEAKATLLILHGMKEHCGRYSDFANFLANSGYAVVVYDHLGHGKTAKTPGGLGYFQKHLPVQKLIEDAKSMAELIEGLFANLPHFVMGHSMGSFITRCLLQQASYRFSGAIIMGSGGKVPIAKLGKALLSVFNQWIPDYRSPFLNKMFDKSNNFHFRKEPDDHGCNWLSRNRDNRQVFQKDPLCGVDFSINGFYALASVNVQATEKQWANQLSKDFPLFFVSGKEDPIGNFGKGIQQTIDDLKQNHFTEINMKLYPNMRHEILNENDKQVVYEDILKWLNAHC
ncbi:alpha/beta fold hydrolase [Elizabethkingia sp. JS20170427COW]|uniref:alpha/beta fold hydrolase n=1 Tax=Elizabethkingia sp. JS20170427COW TaxID=2583851 RepID=UPI0011106E9F|nr:alpha/beta fold hydrolase [Elizabethkingia sp. JS20170427COW]QCX52448.1 alpha/beta hydrolase [Elizabethkingia sp. JS20170427COW]